MQLVRVDYAHVKPDSALHNRWILFSKYKRYWSSWRLRLVDIALAGITDVIFDSFFPGKLITSYPGRFSLALGGRAPPSKARDEAWGRGWQAKASANLARVTRQLKIQMNKITPLMPLCLVRSRWPWATGLVIDCPRKMYFCVNKDWNYETIRTQDQLVKPIIWSWSIPNINLTVYIHLRL